MSTLISQLFSTEQGSLVPHFKESAKLSFILDPLIIELRQSFLTADHLGILETVFDALSTAKASVSNIKSATFKNVVGRVSRPARKSKGSCFSGKPHISLYHKGHCFSKEIMYKNSF